MDEPPAVERARAGDIDASEWLVCRRAAALARIMENVTASDGRCDLITGTKRLRIVGHGRRLRVRAHGDWRTNPLDGLSECRAATAALDKSLAASIARARSAGFSWADIGRTLGAADDATDWSEVEAGLVRSRQAIWGGGLGECE